MLLIYSVVFVLGTVIGSFLNVVIFRYHTGFGLITGSFCFSCSTPLKPRHLIPIFSFLFQRGRCAGCSVRISPQYPIVEAISGFLFILVVYIFGKNLLLDLYVFSSFLYTISTILFYWVIVSLLVAIVVYDFRHKIIPDIFVYTFSALAFVWVLFLLFHNPSPGFYDVLAGPFAAAPFAVLWFISRGRWIGLGDAKLALGIGWLLGIGGAFVSFIFAFWAGALVGLSLLIVSRSFTLFSVTRRFTIKSEIPFAPFMVFGFFMVLFSNLTFGKLVSAIGNFFFFL